MANRITEGPELLEPVIVARASAVLPAAGAFDSAPTEFAAPGVATMMLFVEYTEGAATGSVQIKVEMSHLSSGDEWFQEGLVDFDPTITAGADTDILVQKITRTFESQGATIEKIVIGPIPIERGAERIRIPCAELGVTATPGTTKVTAVLS